MSRAVQFRHYGDVNVLKVVDVAMPQPRADRVIVEVRAAGINPGEAMIRSGALEKVWPAQFPSGEGSDFSGLVVAVGSEVRDFAPGDEVLGWSDGRSSHATHVSVPSDHIVRKPPQLSWEVAGALYVAGMAAWASVDAVNPKKGDIVVVSGAAGGVGSIAVQLLVTRAATVIALASPKKHDWLKQRGAIPVDHDENTIEHIRKATPSGCVDAWVDVFGGGYVEMAIQLGVPPERINTIADFAAAKRYGVKTQGTAAVKGAAVLAQLAALVAEGKVEVSIAARYPLDEVREAYTELEKRHTLGKIVLVN